MQAPENHRASAFLGNHAVIDHSQGRRHSGRWLHTWFENPIGHYPNGYSGVIPAIVMTPADLLISLLMQSLNSSGVPDAASMPCESMNFETSVFPSIATMARLSRATRDGNMEKTCGNRPQEDLRLTPQDGIHLHGHVFVRCVEQFGSGSAGSFIQEIWF